MPATEPLETTAVYLRAGDLFDFGSLSSDLDDAIRVEAVDLAESTDGRTLTGLLAVTGWIVAGRDRGYRCRWSVPFTQPVEVVRDRPAVEEKPREEPSEGEPRA